MSVNVSKFTKKKEGSTSVVVNNSNKGYSNTTTAGSLDRMLWDIHDTGQDITGTPTLPALNVNGQINAGGKIHSDTEVNAPTGRFSYLYPDYIYECKEGHISYLYSDFIDTDDLKVNNTAEIKNIISEHISTQYLDVTKSAHFAELIIDKIKSVGGSAVFSPADGFKIANEADIIQIYDSNGNVTNYWMLCWDGEDDRGATVNMWERNDQALCQNFNEATTGVSHNISNTYFWMLVFTAGTYNPENPADIMYDHGTSEDYINQSSYRQETAYNSEGEKITFDTLKHYIVVYNSNSRFTDAERNTEYVRDGSFNPKAGNEVVMLGHRARLDEMYLEEYKKRQSAIYIAAYNSTIEPDLMAPLIAQYQGINDFNLSTHRTTHFAAGHNDIFGYDNVIRGSFKTINGTDITDLNGVTYFIKSNKAYIPVTSDWYIGNNAFNITLECMYISGDNGPAYVGTRNNNMSLRIQYSYNGGQPKNKDAEYSQITDPYTFDLRDFVLQNTNGYIDSLSFLIMEGTNIVYQYNIPVIRQSGSNPGDDAEFYKMNPIRELAQVDVEGNFVLYLQYEVQHIIGDEITTADNTDYSIQFTIWDENNNREQTKTVPFVSPYFTYDKDGNPAYEKVNVFGTYGSRSLLHDQYIEVKLIKNNGAVEVERRVIPVTLVAGAMFSVTDSITSRVTASETTANTAYNMASQAVQTAQGFDQRVTKTETDISYQQDTITGLQTDVSRIQQTADTITSEVTKISGVGGENLIVNSSFQVSEGVDMPERWDYYDTNTIVTSYESGSVNYVNINNSKNQITKGRGIIQNSSDRYDNVVQDLYGNHIYCFSFYGKKNSTYGEISCFIHYLDNTGTMLDNSLRNQVYYDFDLTDDWTRYCFIFRTPDYNNIHGFNIILEYYGVIKRNNESTVPVRYNNVDIMMPMLLDYGEVTTEKQDLYGLYRLDGDTRVYYDVWTNGDYDADLVAMWQGNSQDVSVSSSQIIQTASNIQLNVYNDLRQTGINITNGQIDLNANNTNIIGNLNLKDSTNGIILYDTNGNARVNILPSNIPDPNTSGFDSRNFIQLYSDEVTKSSSDNVDTRTSRQSIGNIQANTSVTFNVTPEIYGIVSSTKSYVSNSIPSITVYFYIYNSSSGGSSIASTSRTLSRTYNNGSYKYSSFTYTHNFTTAGTYYIEMRLTGDDSNDRYTKYTINAFTDYTKKVESLTYVGLDGLLVGTANSKYAKISKDGYEFRWIDQNNNSDAIKMSGSGLQRLYDYDTLTSEPSSWVGISGYKPATLITNSNVTAINSNNKFYVGSSQITNGYYYLVQPNDCNIMITADYTYSTPLYIRLTDGAGSGSGTPKAGRCIYIRNFSNTEVYVCHGNTSSTAVAILNINSKSQGSFSKQINNDTYMFMAIPEIHISTGTTATAQWAIYSQSVATTQSNT